MNFPNRYDYHLQLFEINKTNSILFQTRESYVSTNYSQMTFDGSSTNTRKGQFQIALTLNMQQIVSTIYTITPRSLMSGISAIGGYLSFFSYFFLMVALAHNKWLQRELKRKVEQSPLGQRYKMEEVFSYENIQNITLELEDLRKTVESNRNGSVRTVVGQLHP